jgi:8-oxo-dGTP diphosphatase
MKRIEVAAALVIQDRKLFATCKGYGPYQGCWEFPGGKIEAGETAQEALVREIHEELAAELANIEPFMVTEYTYPEQHVTMHTFTCTFASSYQLLEAQDARWLRAQDFTSVGWLPADDAVLAELMRTNLID